MLFGVSLQTLLSDVWIEILRILHFLSYMTRTLKDYMGDNRTTIEN